MPLILPADWEFRSGVYRLAWPASISGAEAYIGSAIRFKTRGDTHFSKLREGTHHCDKLQDAYRSYGEECLTFTPVEFVDIEGRSKEEARQLLLAVEQKWIDRGGPDLYNTCRIAGSCYGVEHDEEARLNMELAQRVFREDSENRTRQEILSQSNKRGKPQDRDHSMTLRKVPINVFLLTEKATSKVAILRATALEEWQLKGVCDRLGIDVRNLRRTIKYSDGSRHGRRTTKKHVGVYVDREPWFLRYGYTMIGGS